MVVRQNEARQSYVLFIVDCSHPPSVPPAGCRERITMKRSAMFLGLLSVLSIPAPAYALREFVVGNQPLGPGFGFGAELLAAVNTVERVYMYNHDGNLFFFFKGGPKALNEAIGRFAAIPADKREIILLPVPAKPLIHDKKPIAYDWCLHVPRVGGLRFGRRFEGDSEIADNRATLTIYIPEPRGPALADPQQARKCIAELDSKDFKIRERATKELIDLGPSIASLLREALKGRPAPEARNRMERILTGVSRVIRLDVLELPDKVLVVGLEELLARCRTELSNKDAVIRGQAASVLVDQGAPAEEVLPDLEKMLKTEKDASPLAGAAWAAYHLGAAARPLLPVLQATAKTADKKVASVFEQAINNIEKAKVEPVPDGDVKKRATIRKEIREFVAGLKGKAGK